MKGTYCLLIKVNNTFEKHIGALGKIKFEKGFYAYIGSAMNSIEARVKRHLRKEKKKHWHIDYLMESRSAKIKKIYIKESQTKEECKVAKKIESIANEVIEKFGASDCECKGHLFRVDEHVLEELLKKEGFVEWFA